jgi:single-strand DNA-binding protein
MFSFTGACGKDAEVRYLPSGQAVLNVNVANNVGFGDKQQTLWIRVVLWGKRAEGQLKDYLKKGQQVFVSGELTMSEYTGNDGMRRTQLEVNATILDLIGKRESGNYQDSPTPVQNFTPPSDYPPPSYHSPSTQNYAPPPTPRTSVPSSETKTSGAFDAPYDDDIPF